MADQKITELTELTTPADADLLAIVDDVVGTPITKKITKSNFLGTRKRFVTRSPTAVDLDGSGSEWAWEDWDLNSITSSTTFAVLVRCVIQDNDILSDATIRCNGETAGDQDHIFRPQVASHTAEYQFVIGCDANQVIETRVTDNSGTTITVCRFYIDGYWETY